MSKTNLVEIFKKDPLIQNLMSRGDLSRVAQLATGMGTISNSLELRQYGRELWERVNGLPSGNQK